MWVSATAMAPSECERVGVGEEVLLRSKQRERFVCSFVCLICFLCRPGWLSASILHPSWASLDRQETNFLWGLVAFEVKIPCSLLKHFSLSTDLLFSVVLFLCISEVSWVSLLSIYIWDHLHIYAEIKPHSAGTGTGGGAGRTSYGRKEDKMKLEMKWGGEASNEKGRGYLAILAEEKQSCRNWFLFPILTLSYLNV